jgi:acetyltransferase-like isoleucine patch superfamily enzyme
MQAKLSHRVALIDPLRLVPRILSKVFTIWVRLVYPFTRLGDAVSFHYTCNLENTALMDIGDFVQVNKDVWLYAGPKPADTGEPVLSVGDHCFIGRRCHIDAKNAVRIDDHVLFAASVLVTDHGHRYKDIDIPIAQQGSTKGGRIHIGHGSWIGQGAVIICEDRELVLGRNCVVAANAVVTRSAPPYSVLSGNPARIVKQYDPARGTWSIGSTRPLDSQVGVSPRRDGSVA